MDSKKIYEGSLKEMPLYKIRLNVSLLKKGNYILKIVTNNKVIEKVKFKKP